VMGLHPRPRSSSDSSTQFLACICGCERSSLTRRQRESDHWAKHFLFPGNALKRTHDVA
jgi:hypothetical protein